MSEFGPWIEHDGNGCPVAPSEIVEAYDLEGDFYEADRADTLGWVHDYEFVGILGFITRYRIRKPKAIEQLRDIAADPQKYRELKDAV